MNRSKTESNSLIMCVTPFQMLLAEKIIELNPDKKFDLFAYAHLDDKKHRYYFDRLKQLCEYSLFYNKKDGKSGAIQFLIDFKLSSLNKKYKNLYLSSIDLRPLQYIVSQNPRARIFTFDDGTANINPSSLFYLDKQNQPSFIKKIVYQAIGASVYMRDIKQLSTLHYTVYKDCPNIIKNTYPVYLFTKDNTTTLSPENSIKIFLGQPLTELSLDIPQNVFVDLLHKLEIDLYYPHPREITSPSGSFEVINTQLIFEDYIVKLIETYPSTYIDIYSFISSASLNVANISKIRPKYVYNPSMLNRYHSFYQTVESFFNVEFVEIDF